jgi:DNA polymerase (family 10)
MTDTLGIEFVSNSEVARILFQIASILEMTQDNIYRGRAYRRAALGVLLLQKSLADYVIAGEEPPLPGVGERIRRRLCELVNTGRMGVYDGLLAELGEPLSSFLALHGVGPKTATRLVAELHVASLPDLLQAARGGRIRTLRGFGPKREANIGDQAELALQAAA